jgi:chemotaxis protein CheX
MRMELIQPFINAADAVLAEMLKCNTRIDEISMDEEVYRRKGMAALILVQGEIEGRVILDMERGTAASVSAAMTGMNVGEIDDDMVREAICELANEVIGNAVVSLNDQGHKFKVHPPEVHKNETGLANAEDTEALVMSFGTPVGNIFMNVAMRYRRRRRGDTATAN